MNHLLDTCVVSELIARRPDPRVAAWVDGHDPAGLFLSAVTIGEIRRGVALLTDSRRKTSLLEWLSDSLLVRFAGRIVPLDAEVFLTWGEMIGALERGGTPMPAMDSLIAATALHHKLRIATRNTSDFRHCGVELIDPRR